MISMSCVIRPLDDTVTYHLTLLLRMDDKMNRQLEVEFGGSDNADVLAEELVHNGFINEVGGWRGEDNFISLPSLI